MTKHLLWALAVTLLVAFPACDDSGGGGSDGDTDTDTDTDTDSDSDTDPIAWYDFDAQAPWFECPTEEFPEEAVVVTAFDHEDQYFTGDENLRTIEATVDFPEDGEWSQVGMWFELSQPSGVVFDSWDRVGSVQMVTNPEADPEDWEKIELTRHVTPYKKAMCQYIDVTPTSGILRGQQTLTSFIDTWVGPGHTDGAGWATTVKFVFYPGPADEADEVINIWGRRGITVGEIEDDVNVDSQIDPVTVSIPADATRVEAHVTTTGHSFGNTLNCAEFCEMRQDVIVNGTVHSAFPWRDDCDQNPVSPQMGTWEHPRNGWCPGAISVGQMLDITDSLTMGGDNEIDFDILLDDGSEYDNTTPVDLLPNELIALRLYVYK